MNLKGLKICYEKEKLPFKKEKSNQMNVILCKQQDRFAPKEMQCKGGEELLSSGV